MDIVDRYTIYIEFIFDYIYCTLYNILKLIEIRLGIDTPFLLTYSSNQVNVYLLPTQYRL